MWLPLTFCLAIPLGLATQGEDVPTPPARAPQGVTLDVPSGVGIDLLRGEVSRDGGHVRLGDTSNAMLLLEPLGEVHVADARSVGKGKSGASPGRWLAPDRNDPSFRNGKGVLLVVDPPASNQVFVRIGDAPLIAVSAMPGTEAAWSLHAVSAIGPEGLLLPEPLELPVAKRTAVGSWTLGLPAPSDRPRHLAPLVGVAFEVEAPYGSERWAPLGETAPGATELVDVDPFQGATDAVVVRLRARYTATGHLSFPGAPLVLLRTPDGPDGPARLVEAALAALDDEQFQVRREARAVLLALHAESRPRLEALEGAPGPLGLAVADVLSALDESDGSALSERRLRSFARAAVPSVLPAGLAGPDVAASDAALDAWLGPVPAGLLAADPLDRVHAMLLAVDRAQRGAPSLDAEGRIERAEATAARASAWARALAEADPDERIRALASFVLEVGTAPTAAPFDPPAPAWLVPPGERTLERRFAAPSTERMPRGRDELVWALEARPELTDLDVGPLLASVIAELRSDARVADPAGDAIHDYDVGTIDLVLRLVDRARERTAAAPELLGAAASLIAEPALELRALRAVSDRRIAEPSRSAAVRERIALSAPSLVELEEILAELGDARWRGVDVLVPSGTLASEGSEPAFLDLRAGGVRIAPLDPAAGPVVIEAGLRVIAARDVVVEGLTLRHAQGQALTLLDGAHAVVIDSELVSGTKIVHLQDSDLEIVDSKLHVLDASTAFGVLAQTIGTARLYVRASSLRGGTVYLGQGAGLAVLDRCVVDSVQRPVLQGQLGARVIVRESFLTGQGMGLVSVSDGYLVASVLDVVQQPIGRGPSDLRVSPRLLFLPGGTHVIPSAQRLAREPFERR